MLEKEDNAYEMQLTGESVSLTLSIGDGQLGGSAVKLPGTDQYVAIGTPAKFPLGSRVDLDGKDLTVRTLVADVNLQSDWTSVTYAFEGAQPTPLIAHHKLARDGNGVLYESVFSFHG